VPIRGTAPSADAVGHWSEREPGLATRAMWQMPVPAGWCGGRRACPASQRRRTRQPASYVKDDTQNESCLLCKFEQTPGTLRLLTVAEDLSAGMVAFERRAGLYAG
jgi:hypothetical protein